MSQPPLARPVARLVGESQASFVERVGVSHDILVEHGIGGIEYHRQLGSTVRLDTARSHYGGSGYGEQPDVVTLLAIVKERVVEEKQIFATANECDARQVYGKIGACGELTNNTFSPFKCYRYADQTQYPTGRFSANAGGLTPDVFAKNGGEVLTHGIEGNVLVSVVEGQTSSWNNMEQGLITNKSATSSACIVGIGEAYSNTNPGCVYIRFVKANLEPSQFVSMMTTHNSMCAALRTDRDRRRAVAKLRAEEGEEIPADENDALRLLHDRQKENKKKTSHENGSAPKKKRCVADDRGQTDARFKAPRGLTFPEGVSKFDIRSDHPRVVWEIHQIFTHLVQVFKRDGASVKMDILTAPSTDPYILSKMKKDWHHGFPAYTSVPRVAMIAALRAFWLAKRPAN